jgi:hypothetical protein
MKITSSTYLFAITGLIAIGLIVVALTQERTPSPYAPLAKCLTEKGAKMYGTWWCSHCERQKLMFGSAFADVNYVECSPNRTRETAQACLDDGIKGFPTWRFADGTELNGEQEPETLAQKAGCESSLPSRE